jgi:hypothetical protein
MLLQGVQVNGVALVFADVGIESQTGEACRVLCVRFLLKRRAVTRDC